MPGKGSLYVCFNYRVPKEGKSLYRFTTMPDYPPFPVPQVPELCILHRKVEITLETSSKLLQNTLRSTGEAAVEKHCHFHMLGCFSPELSDIQHHSYIFLPGTGQPFSLQYQLTSVPR